MTTRNNTRWAQFRLAVIGSLIFSPLERGRLGRELNHLAEQEWIHPISGNVFMISYATIERWYYQARSNPDDPLAVLQNSHSDVYAPRSMPYQAQHYIQCQVSNGCTYPFSEYHRRVLKMTEKHGWGRPPSYNVVRRYCLSLKSAEEHRVRKEGTRLIQLVAHLRRALIAKSVVVRLLKNSKITSTDGYADFQVRGLRADDKLYVIRRLQDYQRSKGSMTDFCHFTGLAEASVSRWIREHARNGKSGLEPRKRRKFPNKTNAKQNAARIMEIFHSQPRLYGINRTSWTGDALAEAFNKTFHLDISSSTVRRYLRSAGYTMRRAKQVLTSPDPQYREKVESLLSVLQSLKPDHLFFFIDEMGPIRVKKHGGRSYVRNGEQRKIPQVQPNKGSVIILGALSATTNQMTWLFDRTKDTRGMIDLIEILFNQYYEKERLFISWDAASWHDSYQLLNWISELNHYVTNKKQGPTIEVLPLPARSQFLDIIESVFGTMKHAVIDNSQYQSVTEMKEAISTHFIERNAHFEKSPRRAGKKIWEIDFFNDFRQIRSGDYREW